MIVGFNSSNHGNSIPTRNQLTRNQLYAQKPCVQQQNPQESNVSALASKETYCDTLQVPLSADFSTIERAYQTKMKEYNLNLVKVLTLTERRIVEQQIHKITIAFNLVSRAALFPPSKELIHKLNFGEFLKMYRNSEMNQLSPVHLKVFDTIISEEFEYHLSYCCDLIKNKLQDPLQEIAHEYLLYFLEYAENHARAKLSECFNPWLFRPNLLTVNGHFIEYNPRNISRYIGTLIDVAKAYKEVGLKEEGQRITIDLRNIFSYVYEDLLALEESDIICQQIAEFLACSGELDCLKKWAELPDRVPHRWKNNNQLSLATHLVKLHRFDEARQYLLTLFGENSTLEETPLIRSRDGLRISELWEKIGEKEKAIEILRNIAIKPDYFYEVIDLGKAFYAKGMEEEALDILDNLSKSCSIYDPSFLVLAFDQIGQHNAAVRFAKKKITNPEGTHEDQIYQKVTFICALIAINEQNEAKKFFLTLPPLSSITDSMIRSRYEKIFVELVDIQALLENYQELITDEGRLAAMKRFAKEKQLSPFPHFIQLCTNYRYGGCNLDHLEGLAYALLELRQLHLLKDVKHNNPTVHLLIQTHVRGPKENITLHPFFSYDLDEKYKNAKTKKALIENLLK